MAARLCCSESVHLGEIDTESGETADGFVEYSDAFFPTTVLSENCTYGQMGVEREAGYMICGREVLHL